ncbi:MAG: hypothetical protein O8C64_15535 [Candidatus Methanoperedens sp.]|nr:hypothetical protein [Candidatus Methanoperedens sp.]MCZ7404720.1 hypothetical protein [Candidatus Methanoperedens sp.]
MREYDALIKEAQSLGIKSPESYYNEGKIKGKAGRDRGEVGHKIPQEGKIVPGDAQALDNDLSKKKEKTQSYYLLKKPGISSLPSLFDKISMTELPKFLGGFKLFNRK